MSVRDLDVAVLRDAVARLLVESNYNIPPDILDALRGAMARETSPLGRRTLRCMPAAINLGCHSMRRATITL